MSTLETEAPGESEAESGTDGTWVEVSLNSAPGNGGACTGPQQLEAVVADALACAAAGAAIIHLQAAGAPGADAEQQADFLSRAFEAIRARCDVIVYPGAPVPEYPGSDAGLRPAALDVLAQRGLLEWLAVDCGSANLCRYDDLREDRPGELLLNPEAHIRETLSIASRRRLQPSLRVLEPGFLRLGATLHWRSSCPAPLYRLTFSSDFTLGFPPEDYSLTALLNLLDQVAPGAQWMVAGLGADVRPLLARVVAEGGHVRVGLGDLPREANESNAALVEEAVRLVHTCGADVATPAKVRARLHALEMGD